MINRVPRSKAAAAGAGGNDANTKVLLDFDVFPFVNTGLDPLAPSITNVGITLDASLKKWGTGAGTDFATQANYIEFATSATELANNDWSLEMQVYTTDVTTNNSLLTNSGALQTILLKVVVGLVVFSRIGGTEVSTAITADAWHWIKLVHASNLFYVYLDGVRFGNAISDVPFSFGARMNIGVDGFSNLGWIFGNVDEFRLQFGDMSSQTGATIDVPTGPYT